MAQLEIYTPVLKASSGSSFTVAKPQLQNAQIENMNLDSYTARNKVTTIKGEKGSYSYTAAGTKLVLEYIDGAPYFVCSTKTKLYSYQEYLLSHDIYQEADWGAWSSKCQNVAYLHCYGFYINKRNYVAKNVDNGNCGGKFKTFISGDLSKIMDTNGRPLVIQVNGKDDGSTRHFVTVVGFTADVKSVADLSPRKLLIIDSCDGQIERMDQPGSRYLTTGKQIKSKDYNGYYIRYISPNSSVKGYTDQFIRIIGNEPDINMSY